MKKFLISLCLFGSLVFAQTPTLTISTTQNNVRSNTVVTSNLTLAANTTVSDLQFTVNLPTDFKPVLTATIGASGTAANKQLECGNLTTNSETCILYGLNTTILGNGIVVTLQTTITGMPSLPSDILGVSNIIAVNGAGISVPINVTTSETITVLSNCDLNGDGSTNVGDLTLLVNWVLGTATIPPGFTADLNGDMSSNIIDVSLEINSILSSTCLAVNY